MCFHIVFLLVLSVVCFLLLLIVSCVSWICVLLLASYCVVLIHRSWICLTIGMSIVCHDRVFVLYVIIVVFRIGCSYCVFSTIILIMYVFDRRSGTSIIYVHKMGDSNLNKVFHLAYCILHITYCILHIAYCISFFLLGLIS